jgi:hypothetical protein
LEQRADPAAELQHIEALRTEQQLEQARSLALSLAAEAPSEAAVLSAASRAESDGLVLFAEREKAVRNAAAASALDYAERAEALGAQAAEARAQLAWALGAATHLQPMGKRAAHAKRTIKTAEAVLAEAPEQPVALATLAVVNLRLETLPWIAQLMASGLPDSSLEQAVAYARRAAAALPSRENQLILARCLKAAGQRDEAVAVLKQSLAAPARFPRDGALLDDVQAELKKLKVK